tara:strand:+ start:553 stop:765 length:213 start_codon:yes stop_codon:yes gene_type:complete
MRHHSFPVWIPEKPAAAPEKEPAPPTPAADAAPWSMENTKDELLSFAEEHGLDLSSRDRKADILAALEAL